MYQHLYIGNESAFEDMKLSCTSSMPWEGKAEIRVGAEKPFELALRVPGYAKDFAVTVNGQAAKGHEEDGYLIVEVKDGDVLNVSFDMDAEIYCANPHVTEDCAKVCVVRGPAVYCAEEADNGKLLQDFRMDPHGADRGGCVRAVRRYPRGSCGGHPQRR